MISQAIINLGIVAITCLLVMLYLIKFVFKYKHQYESNPLCTLTVIICLLIVFLTAFVLPVDIFLVSFVKEPDGSFKSWATNETLATIDNAVYATYYSLYGIVTFLIFIVIPFLHFFNEESESNSSDRLHQAIKNTLGFVLLITLLLMMGAFLHDGLPEPNTIFDKVIPTKNITKLHNAITLVLTVITTAGFINVSFYTASGILSWPIGLIMGTSSLSDRHKAISNQADFLRVGINNLQQKSRIEPLSPGEQEQLRRAEEELRQLDREETVLSGHSASWSYKLRKAIRPIQIIVGIAFGLLSILLIATLVISNIDRILHSAGPKQGYVLIASSLFNPLEYIFIKSQDLIFIGPLPLLIVTCFLVVATISGMRNLGLWFMLARLYHVRVGRTSPRALLFFCVSIMLTACAFNLILYSMTPQYITFGDQLLKVDNSNGTIINKPCTLQDYHPDCLITRGSMLIMQMMSQIWVVGAVFYWCGWTFVVVASISLIAYVMRGKRQAAHDVILTEEEFED